MAWRPTEDHRIEAIRRLLSGLQDGADAHELAVAVADLHPTNNTFPGEVFMALGADALDVAGIGRATSIPYEGLLEAHLPECVFRGLENRKIQYAILTSAALRAGLEPDLLHEVVWWRTDDHWRYGLYCRRRADTGRRCMPRYPVPQLAGQLAERHGLADPS